MMLIDGKLYEAQVLPTSYFDRTRPLAYIMNPKVASAMAMNFVFFVNHSYRYFDPADIYRSPTALLRIGGAEFDPRLLKAFYQLSPETYSIVSDPLRHFISGFLSKIFTDQDTPYYGLRDILTSLHGIDLSPEANPRHACVAFAKWIAAQKDQKAVDWHFRPQYLNLAASSRFSVNTILRLEDGDGLLAFYTKWVGAEKAK